MPAIMMPAAEKLPSQGADLNPGIADLPERLRTKPHLVKHDVQFLSVRGFHAVAGAAASGSFATPPLPARRCSRQSPHVVGQLQKQMQQCGLARAVSVCQQQMHG